MTKNDFNVYNIRGGDVMTAFNVARWFVEKILFSDMINSGIKKII